MRELANISQFENLSKACSSLFTSLVDCNSGISVFNISDEYLQYEADRKQSVDEVLEQLRARGVDDATIAALAGCEEFSGADFRDDLKDDYLTDDTYRYLADFGAHASNFPNKPLERGFWLDDPDSYDENNIDLNNPEIQKYMKALYGLGTFQSSLPHDQDSDLAWIMSEGLMNRFFNELYEGIYGKPVKGVEGAELGEKMWRSVNPSDD